MSSETITRNDLMAILNEVLPPTTTEYRKLIYSGALVSGGITLSESVANFDQLMINAEDNDGVKKTFIINVRNNGVFSTYLDFDRITGMWYVKSMLLSFNGTNISVSYNCQSYDNGGVSSSSYVAVTEIYGIKYDHVASPQTEISTYSTTEQVVGTWIDGKPIYRKVYIPFEAKSYTSGSYTVTLDVPIGKIIRWDVLTTGNGNENQEVNKYIVPGRYSKTPNQISLDCNTSSYNTNITHIILEYTKSTD